MARLMSRFYGVELRVPIKKTLSKSVSYFCSYYCLFSSYLGVHKSDSEIVILGQGSVKFNK